MKENTYYLDLNRERIRQELLEIDDEFLTFTIYRYVQEMRKKVDRHVEGL